MDYKVDAAVLVLFSSRVLSSTGQQHTREWIWSQFLLFAQLFPTKNQQPTLFVKYLLEDRLSHHIPHWLWSDRQEEIINLSTYIDSYGIVYPPLWLVVGLWTICRWLFITNHNVNMSLNWLQREIINGGQCESVANMRIHNFNVKF